HARRGGGRAPGDRIPGAARAARHLTHVRQLDLPGPAVPRALAAEAGGVLPLPQPRRLDLEGAGAAVAAGRGEGDDEDEAGQARGARRHLRVDRGAEVLPQVRNDDLVFPFLLLFWKFFQEETTSTIASISTGIPIGREPMPTAERACLPASPSTSTKRSEQ